MCVPKVNYKQKNYGKVTEKMAFKCIRSFSGGTTNLQQQNPCMASGIKFLTIPYCASYYLLYQKFLAVCAYL